MRITPTNLGALDSLRGSVYIDTNVWLGHGARREATSPEAKPNVTLRRALLGHLDGTSVEGLASDLVEMEFGGAMAERLSSVDHSLASAEKIAASIDHLHAAWRDLAIRTAEVASVVEDVFGSAKSFFASVASLSRRSTVRIGGSDADPKFSHIGLVDAMHVRIAEAMGANYLATEDSAFEGIQGSAVTPLVLGVR